MFSSREDIWLCSLGYARSVVGVCGHTSGLPLFATGNSSTEIIRAAASRRRRRLRAPAVHARREREYDHETSPECSTCEYRNDVALIIVRGLFDDRERLAPMTQPGGGAHDYGGPGRSLRRAKAKTATLRDPRAPPHPPLRRTHRSTPPTSPDRLVLIAAQLLGKKAERFRPGSPQGTRCRTAADDLPNSLPLGQAKG